MKTHIADIHLKNLDLEVKFTYQAECLETAKPMAINIEYAECVTDGEGVNIYPHVNGEFLADLKHRCYEWLEANGYD
jgi:hypothetical protein